MSGQTQPETALQALAETLRTDAIAIFGEGQAERDIIEWFYGAMLAAAPAHQAERQEQEDLHVWRATTRFGETCHFGEASTARAWAGENGTVERVDLTPVPELRVVERHEASNMGQDQAEDCDQETCEPTRCACKQSNAKQDQGEVQSTAARDVLAERRRQIEAEGMTTAGDDGYHAAELPRAAASYILNGANDEAPAIWPWAKAWWKPRDARTNYVRAGALILAEIERLDRAALAASTGQEV